MELTLANIDAKLLALLDGDIRYGKTDLEEQEWGFDHFDGDEGHSVLDLVDAMEACHKAIRGNGLAIRLFDAAPNTLAFKQLFQQAVQECADENCAPDLVGSYLALRHEWFRVASEVGLDRPCPVRGEFERAVKKARRRHPRFDHCDLLAAA